MFTDIIDSILPLTTVSTVETPSIQIVIPLRELLSLHIQPWKHAKKAIDMLYVQDLVEYYKENPLDAPLYCAFTNVPCANAINGTLEVYDDIYYFTALQRLVQEMQGMALQRMDTVTLDIQYNPTTEKLMSLIDDRKAHVHGWCN